MRFSLVLLLSLFPVAPAFGQTAPLPPPPKPAPSFMFTQQYPLPCFDKVTTETDGVELFLCNGHPGLAGARKKNDPNHTIYVRNNDIANNLNLQTAKSQCRGKVMVTEESGIFDMQCGEKRLDTSRFQAALKSDWLRFEAMLYK